MGHKINPDIFRLGVSKKWTFVMRTNKNFIKNIFLFKLLKNLFMNYSIPFFNFRKRRNSKSKFNDRIKFKGEKQLNKSPFVRANVLFSHVYFGLYNDEITIDSYFIDVNLKQTRRKLKNPPDHFNARKRDDVNFWQPEFYKKNVFDHFKKKKFFDEKNLNKLKMFLYSRRFNLPRRIHRKLKVKSAKRLSMDLYYASTQYYPKYYPRLKKYFTYVHTYKFKSFLFLIQKSLRRKEKIGLKYLKYFKYLLEKKHFGIKGRIKVINLYKRIIKRKKRYYNLWFMIKRVGLFVQRMRQKKPRRYLKPYYYKHTRASYYGLRRRESSKNRINRMVYLAKKTIPGISNSLLSSRNTSISPLYIYNITERKKYTFYRVYKNIKTLKYFIRCLKYFKYFDIKKRIFFCQNLIALIFNIFGVINKTIITKKLFLIMQVLIYYSYSLSFYGFLNLKKKYLNKFLMYKAVSKTLFRSVVELIKCNKVVLQITAMSKYKLNSSLVLNYIIIKLNQHFNIHDIINPLSFFIKNLTIIGGYKILISGRVSRKERAAALVRSGRKMPLSTIEANIDYSQGTKIMKFGMVGIKVYLLVKPNSLFGLYKFKFKYAKAS